MPDYPDDPGTLDGNPTEDTPIQTGQEGPEPATPEGQAPQDNFGGYDSLDELKRAHQERQRLLDRQADELGRYRALIQTMNIQGTPQAAPPPKPKIQVGEQLFVDPDQALNQTVEVAVSEAEKRFLQRLAAKEAADSFFQANADLNSPAGRRLAQVHAQEVMATMTYLSPVEQTEEVAKRVRADLAQLRQQSGKSATPPPHVGAGGGVRPAPPAPPREKSEAEQYRDYMNWRRGQVKR
jgi:hypothetical protein